MEQIPMGVVRPGEGDGCCNATDRVGGPTVRLSMVTSKTLFLTGVCLVLAGCGDRVRSPAPEQLARFQAADQAGPAVDMNRVLQAKITPGPYRAVPGDVLHVEMARLLEQQPIVETPVNTNPAYNCRIGDDGTIVLPIIGAVPVRGRSLAEIEATIAGRYYPRYVTVPLPVYVSVLEYKTERVSIVGSVTQPGIHALRHDQMSLVGLLMQAGGIAVPGAAVIRINRANTQPRDSLPVDISVPFGAREVPPSGGQLEAVFEREGPLRTTGWLRVEQDDGQVSLRQWLDIGNGPQRREFIATLAAQSTRAATEDLAVKLVRLGAYLDQRPETEDGAADWRTLENGRFVATLNASTPERGMPSQTLAAKLPVELASAVGSARGDVPQPRRTEPRPRPAQGLGGDPRSSLPRSAPEAPSPEARNSLPATANPDAKRPVWESGPAPVLAPGNSANSAPKPKPDASDLRPRIPAPGQGQSVAQTRGVETLVLPVRGLNIPFADVALEEGDTVVVEPPREQWVSIVGLVEKPGNMPFPPGARINLIQAIAFAGGLSLVADPRYVSVYRLTADGEIVSTTFHLVNPHRQQSLTDSLALPLKPGDVVSVEHTPRTRTNVFLNQVFRITLGLYLTPEGLWHD